MNKTLSSAEVLLFGGSNRSKDKDAVIQPAAGGAAGEQHFSYSQFYELIDAYEAEYRARGVKAGDRILMTGPNSVRLAASIFACWRLGVMAIPVDFRMTGQELANVALKVDVKLALVSQRFADRAKLEENVGDKKKLIATLEDFAESGKQSGSQGAGGSAGTSGFNADHNFSALMILTSGTTGTPKGAVHDFHSLLANFSELGELAGLDSEVVALLPLPVSHIFGLEVLACCIVYGATILFCELEPSKFVAAINKHRPHILSGVPLMYGSLLSDSVPAGAVDLSRTRVLLSGGAPLPVTLAKDFEKKFGKRINNGYGSTESKIIALNLDGPVESIGRPVPSVKVHIIDKDGNDLPEGSEGEIVIESPHLMQGYLGQPETTKEVMTERGYRTGDIGYLKDGYIFISGRAKEMIVVAGNKVFPSEVEEVLSKNPLVAEVAVTGPEHRKLGQIVKATIVVKDEQLSKKLEEGANKPGDPGSKEAREEILKNLKQFCQENLKRELRPMEWDLRPCSQPLPKTRSGKVDKKGLA